MRITFAAYLLFWFVLSLVAAEWAFRFAYPARRAEMKYEYDSASIYVPRPHLTGSRRTNSLGAWGGELDADKETILVMGDSNIEARFTTEADRFPAQLESKLRSFQVANFGVAGYGPDQSVLRLESLLRHHRYQLGNVRAVVLHIFADNDLGDLIKNNIPAFNKRVAKFPERTLLEFTLAGRAARKSEIAHIIYDYVRNSRFGSYLLPDGYYTYKYGSGDLVGAFGKYKLGKYTNVFADEYGAAIVFNVSPELTRTALSTLERVLGRFKDLSVRYQFCPLVLVEPAEIDAAISGAPLPDWVSPLVKTHQWDPRRLSLLIEEISVKVGLPTVSLYSAFKGKPFYYPENEMPGDDHWNPEGMKEAARLTAQRLGRDCGLDTVNLISRTNEDAR